MKKTTSRVREFMVICPGCLTFETLWFKAETIEMTVRFLQREDGRVYHDCRLTDKPCRLYPKFPEECK
jgi:hypothetical protein